MVQSGACIFHYPHNSKDTHQAWEKSHLVEYQSKTCNGATPATPHMQAATLEEMALAVSFPQLRGQDSRTLGSLCFSPPTKLKRLRELDATESTLALPTGVLCPCQPGTCQPAKVTDLARPRLSGPDPPCLLADLGAEGQVPSHPACLRPLTHGKVTSMAGAGPRVLPA